MKYLVRFQLDSSPQSSFKIILLLADGANITAGHNMLRIVIEQLKL